MDFSRQTVDGLRRIADLFQSVEWSSKTRDIYQQIADQLLGIAGCDFVCIRLLSSAGDELIGYVFAGEGVSAAKKYFPTIPADLGRMHKLLCDLEPVVYNFDAPEEDDVTSEEGVLLGYGHAISVPLLNNEVLVGAIDFIYKKGSFDTASETVSGLAEIGRILGPISGTLSTSEELLELRVSEETKRIGSELHDNFAQPLSVIVLEADKALLAYDDGEDGQMVESLNKVSDLSRQAFDMLTQEIAVLHSAVGNSENLVQDIRQYVVEFERHWGMSIALEVPEADVVVSKTVGNQTMRILHEALSNVLRHARAQHVSVRVESGRGAFELSIEDDGCGFNVNRLSSEQLGLRIMEERAKNVGGAITIVSVIDEGTSVIADLPLIA